MVFSALIQNFLANYGFLLAFFGALFGGEETILSLAFLSATGLISPIVVFIFALLGVFTCDFILFMIGRTRTVKNISEFRKITHIHTKIDSLITKLSMNKTFLALLYSRFFIGVKSVMLVCLGLRKISITKFIIYDLIASLIWLTVFMYIGYFAGANFMIILDYFNSLKLALFFLIILIILFFILRHLFTKKLPKLLEKLTD